MKKLLVLLGILCAFCFVSCGNIQLADGDMGVVSLAIGDELAGQIRSAAASRNGTGDDSYTVTGILSGGHSAEAKVSVDSSALAEATLSFENVPVGVTVTLNLSVQAGANLVWVGNSESHVVSAGKNSLTIALGRVSGVLMWDSSSVKIAPYGNYDFDNATSIEDPAQDLPPIWSFDNKGDLYVLGANNAIIPYSLKADGTYTTLYGSGGSITGDAPSFLSYDNVSFVLYGMRETGVIVYLNAKDSSWEVKDELNSDGAAYLGFAVNDDIAYVVEQSNTGSSSLKVKSYNLKLAKEKVGKEILLPASLGANLTGQMIYHESFLYLLLSAFDITNDSGASEQYSCGAIVKINPQTLAVDTSFGNGGFLGLVSKGIEVSGNTDDGATYNQTLYTPTESNVETTFCGPAGFVAVMPKKLVIGDGGYILSDNGGAGLLAKRKSRIITVDLETLAFDIVNIDSSDLYGNLADISGFITPTYD
ncbi:MAG: hypothetical protein IKW26_01675 [Treponema sp.]|nr:hypothetical protein [Treponema sp.]